MNILYHKKKITRTLGDTEIIFSCRSEVLSVCTLINDKNWWTNQRARNYTYCNKKNNIFSIITWRYHIVFNSDNDVVINQRWKIAILPFFSFLLTFSTSADQWIKCWESISPKSKKKFTKWFVSAAMLLIRGSFLHGPKRMYFFSLRFSLLNQVSAGQWK